MKMYLKENVENFLKKGILISPDILGESFPEIEDVLSLTPVPIVLDKIVLEKIADEKTSKKIPEEKLKQTLRIKNKNMIEEKKFINKPNYELPEPLENIDMKKRSINDFVSLYNTRYSKLSSILKYREKMGNVTSISRISGESGEVSFIGMVLDIRLTKNNNFLISFEDKTGVIEAIITENNKEVYNLAKELTYDEVVGIVGTMGKGLFFVNEILFPDFPSKNLKKIPFR